MGGKGSKRLVCRRPVCLGEMQWNLIRPFPLPSCAQECERVQLGWNLIRPTANCRSILFRTSVHLELQLCHKCGSMPNQDVRVRSMQHGSQNKTTVSSHSVVSRLKSAILSAPRSLLSLGNDGGLRGERPPQRGKRKATTSASGDQFGGICGCSLRLNGVT